MGLRVLTLHPNTLDPGRTAPATETGHRAAGRNPSLFEDPQLSIAAEDKGSLNKWANIHVSEMTF